MILAIQVQRLPELALDKRWRVLGCAMSPVPTGVLKVSVKRPVPNQPIGQLACRFCGAFPLIPKSSYLTITKCPRPDLKVVDLPIPCSIVKEPVRVRSFMFLFLISLEAGLLACVKTVELLTVVVFMIMYDTATMMKQRKLIT